MSLRPHPSQRGSTLGERFQEGVDARAKGKTLGDNPHCIDTADHHEWSEGFKAVFDLDEEDDPASDRDQPDKTGDG